MVVSLTEHLGQAPQYNHINTSRDASVHKSEYKYKYDSTTDSKKLAVCHLPST